MEIMDIIKEAFIFPSQNIEKLAIYIALTFVIAILMVGGVFSCAFSNENTALVILGIILFIASFIVSLVMMGYQLGIMKSGIDFDENAPAFDWINDGINGIKLLIVNIVYFIIPAIITGIVAIIANVPGSFMQIIEEYTANINATAVANSTATAMPVVSDAAWASLFNSIAITAIVALILFIIFGFIETMGQARLANTGSLGNALNVIEAAKDIPRIGVAKVLALIILVVVIGVVIQGIVGYLTNQIPQISIISVVITPYLIFFTQRAYGLLYSDIA
ncbi:MAG: DUF4013 domain-containing protein [Methanobacteriaceae archaeon]|nr:DUF4013 domain-containing protein [Methanobacteriaceae archaeon]